MRFVLDENVEHEVGHRLENYGHDVVYVDTELGKGVEDDSIAAYSLRTDRVLVTYDDDFVLDIDEESYHAVLYVGDAALAPESVADAVHEVTGHVTQDELTGLVYVGEEWL